MKDYQIIIYSLDKATNIVGLATSSSDSNLYLVTRDKENTNNLAYYQLAAIDGSQSSLVTHEHDGLMSKADKIVFDKLMSYIDVTDQGITINKGDSNLALTDDKIAFSNNNNNFNMDAEATKLEYQDKNSFRSLQATKQQLSYVSDTIVKSENNLEKILTWLDWNVITSNKTPSGTILSPNDTGVLRDVSATNTFTPQAYGSVTLHVGINSQKDFDGAGIIIYDSLTKQILGSITGLDVGYRLYECVFEVKSIDTKFDISIYSYKSNKIEFSEMYLEYPNQKTNFHVGEELNYTSKSNAKLTVKQDVLSFKTDEQGKRTNLLTDILGTDRINLGQQLVIDTTDDGVGFFKSVDYEIIPSNFTVSAVENTWEV